MKKVYVVCAYKIVDDVVTFHSCVTSDWEGVLTWTRVYEVMGYRVDRQWFDAKEIDKAGLIPSFSFQWIDKPLISEGVDIPPVTH